MDLARWSKVVYRLLKPGGKAFIFDGHPLAWVWDPEAATWQLDRDPRFGNYFSEVIAVDQGWPASYIPEAVVPPREQQTRKYERQWTLGQIVTALATAGLRVEHLGEYPLPYWNQFPHFSAETATKLPHTFSLLLTRDNS